ncbi:uncharacterized protein [Amphiura filiformis]|uniref:uncharacterized protein n=1 Tax=Amphiura filiformis TaxID=82378 RepID=UPI003B2180F7
MADACLSKKEILMFLIGASIGAIFLQLLIGVSPMSQSVPSISTSRVPVALRYYQQESSMDAAAEKQEPRFVRQETTEEKPKQRKILLDCGGNVASTVELFRNTYPGGRDFIIHSFEIDERLAPYFSPYEKHVLHCPEGVASKDGNMTAFVESVWSPTRGLDNGRDMQWGGGSLFVSNAEKKDKNTGGNRKLAVRPTIPTIDLSRWIRENTNKEDYVIFKLDVEGAEFDILKKMMAERTFDWVDKYYGEFHVWQPVSGWTQEQKKAMVDKDIKKAGKPMVEWAAENREYKDFDQLHPIKVPSNTPGSAGANYSTCGTTAKKLAISIAIGMNLKRASKIVSILEAYRVKMPVMLFVYGDFAELYPDIVKAWANRFDIGMREDGPHPPGHFELYRDPWVREALVSTELRLQELDIQPAFYLCHNSTSNIVKAASSRGLRIIKPAADFPPREGTTLQYENYYKFRDVERVPKALRILNDRLELTHGGVLTLDTDLPDTRMNIVFLLDFLVEKSGYDLVSVSDCVASFVTSTPSKT